MIPTLFLLNPQWQLLQLSPIQPIADGVEYTLKVKNDRLDNEQDIIVKILQYQEPTILKISLTADYTREITFTLTQEDQITKIHYSELRACDFSIEEKREIVYWIRSIGNYHLICKSKKPWIKVWRWFIDKCWLKMSPAGRRIVFFVIVSEFLTILVLIAYVIFKII